MAKSLPAVRRKPAQDAFDALISSPKGARFRLSDVTKVVYPFTVPRSDDVASGFASKLIAEAHKAGRVTREGHLHWRAVPPREGRTLADGRLVAESPRSHKLTVNTRCPAKWAAVDLETGEVFQGTEVGWLRASEPVMDSLEAAVAGARGARAA